MSAAFRFFPLVLLLTACSGTMHLYPTNETAKQMGVIELAYEENFLRDLTGTVTGTMQSGETLRGQFATIDTGTYDEGSVYATVWGKEKSTKGDTKYETSTSGHSSASSKAGSRQGTANLMGDRGTYLECEFTLNEMGGGLGTCEADNGALYKMQIQ